MLLPDKKETKENQKLNTLVFDVSVRFVFNGSYAKTRFFIQSFSGHSR